MLVATIAAVAVVAGCGSSNSNGPVALNWYVFPEPSGSFATAAANCSKASGGKYDIKINFLSTASDQQRVSLVRRLAANDSSIDILAMDVDWTAEFADAKWIRPVPTPLASQIRRQDLAGPVQTATYNGRMFAVPINSNTELLWYRKDLVPNPPKTWTQMIADARQLAREGKPHYIEEQGAQYEGLTVWFNSMLDSAGGAILQGNKVVIGEPAKIAAAIMHRLATSPAADASLNVTMEGQSDTAFDQGNAAFEINYPFVWDSAQKTNPTVFKQMGYASFPEVVPGLTPHVSIGGYNLGDLFAFQAPGARVRGRPVLDPAGEPAARRRQGRLGSRRHEHLQQSGVREGVSLPFTDQAAAHDLRPAAADPGLRGRDAGDPEGALANVEYRPEQRGQHAAQ